MVWHTRCKNQRCFRQAWWWWWSAVVLTQMVLTIHTRCKNQPWFKQRWWLWGPRIWAGRFDTFSEYQFLTEVVEVLLAIHTFCEYYVAVFLTKMVLDGNYTHVWQISVMVLKTFPRAITHTLCFRKRCPGNTGLGQMSFSSFFILHPLFAFNAGKQRWRWLLSTY